MTGWSWAREVAGRPAGACVWRGGDLERLGPHWRENDGQGLISRGFKQ